MTEKNDFKYFESRVKYWLNYFGLLNWDVSVFEDDGDDEGNLAYTTFNVDNRCAYIFLCNDWLIVEKNKFELDKTAFHEVVEVLLLRIRDLAGKRTFDYDEFDGEIHNVIRILTATIFEEKSQC